MDFVEIIVSVIELAVLIWIFHDINNTHWFM